MSASARERAVMATYDEVGELMERAVTAAVTNRTHVELSIGMFFGRTVTIRATPDGHTSTVERGVRATPAPPEPEEPEATDPAAELETAILDMREQGYPLQDVVARAENAYAAGDEE